MPGKERLLRLAEVEERTGLSATSIYERMRKGQFPAPVRLSRKAVRWVESEIDEYISGLIASLPRATGDEPGPSRRGRRPAPAKPGVPAVG